MSHLCKTVCFYAYVRPLKGISLSKELQGVSIKNNRSKYIFSSLGIETKLIENLLPLGLEDDGLHLINDLNMHNY